MVSTVAQESVHEPKWPAECLASARFTASNCGSLQRVNQSMLNGYEPGGDGAHLPITPSSPVRARNSKIITLAAQLGPEWHTVLLSASEHGSPERCFVPGSVSANLT